MPGRRKRDWIPINNQRVLEAGNGITFTDIGVGNGYRGYKTEATRVEVLFPTTNTVVDNANGTVTINQNGGGVEAAIRPINELNLLSGSLDTTADKFVVYDASTGNHVWVPGSVINAPEVFRNNGPLSGVAPAPYKVGIDYSTGTQYYVNGAGNWQAFPPGTTVVLTDLPNGKLSINAGLGGTQEAIRPIEELATVTPTAATLIPAQNTSPTQSRVTAGSILALTTNVLAKPTTNTIQSTVNGVVSASQPIIATNTLTSAGNTMTNTTNGIAGSAPIINTNTLTKPTSNTITSTVNGIASAAQPIIATNVTTVANAGISTTINGVVSNIAPIFATTAPIASDDTDTTLRNAVVGTAILAARADHKHPIRRQAAPNAPVPVIGGTGATIVATTVGATITDEESAEFKLTLQINQAIANAWTTITIPAIAGYQTPLVNITGTYRNSGNMTGWAPAPTMAQEAAVYFNGTIYLNTPNRTVVVSTYLFLTIKYIRS